MRIRGWASATASAVSVVAVAAWGQAPKNPTHGPVQSTARVETAALELVAPDRYQVPIVLEPSRRVAIMATADGIVKDLLVPLGATVRESQEVVQLDRVAAAARLKIARAEVKETEAMAAGKAGSEGAIAQARVDGAQARAELAQLDLDRCTLRAPFPGRIMAYPVSKGQYVAKGTTVADLADVSSLRVLVPVDRTTIKDGGSLDLVVEGKKVTGKVQAMIPLPDVYSSLRELATPWTAAWVTIANPDGKAHEPGQRVNAPLLPTAPVAVVPGRAIHDAEDPADGSIVQVVRSEYVTTVPIRVLGPVGPERMQVSGPFRPADIALVESTIPLASGTLIRFGTHADGPVEGVAPKPGLPGVVADITPPVGTAVGRSPGSRIAPIGSPDGRSPKSARPGATKPPNKPAAAPF